MERTNFRLFYVLQLQAFKDTISFSYEHATVSIIGLLVARTCSPHYMMQRTDIQVHLIASSSSTLIAPSFPRAHGTI